MVKKGDTVIDQDGNALTVETVGKDNQGCVFSFLVEEESGDYFPKDTILADNEIRVSVEREPDADALEHYLKEADFNFSLLHNPVYIPDHILLTPKNYDGDHYPEKAVCSKSGLNTHYGSALEWPKNAEQIYGWIQYQNGDDEPSHEDPVEGLKKILASIESVIATFPEGGRAQKLEEARDTCVDLIENAEVFEE